jgi:Sulfotransferase domain
MNGTPGAKMLRILKVAVASMTTQATTTKKGFGLRTGLFWVASYPKSGNTWVRAFLANLAAILAGESDELTLNEINRFSTGENFARLYEKRLGFKPTEKHRKEIAGVRHEIQKSIADEHDGLVFVKTHNGLVMDCGRPIINFAVTSSVIYVVRNPLDVAISLSHHMGLTIDDAIEMMGTRGHETPIDEKVVHEIWGSWSENVESWTRTPHRAIYVMCYENMLSDPQIAFGGLVRHLHLDVTPSQLNLAIERSLFAKLKDKEEKEGFQERSVWTEHFFREGRAGQWKEILTPAQIQRIVSDHGKQMARLGYLPS